MLLNIDLKNHFHFEIQLYHSDTYAYAIRDVLFILCLDASAPHTSSSIHSMHPHPASSRPATHSAFLVPLTA